MGLGEKVEPEPVSVLLAEHEPEVAEMSARYLRRDGLRVRLVTTPEQALAELTGGPDAAAVLDLTMPGLDPRRIRRALRTPVIFLVAGHRGPGRAAWPAAAGRPARGGGWPGPSAPASWSPWSATCWPRPRRRRPRARNQPEPGPEADLPEPGGPPAGSGSTAGLCGSGPRWRAASR